MTDDQTGAQEAVYLRVVQAISDGREDVVDELFAEEFVDHNPIPGQSAGPAGFKEWMRGVRSAFPDLSASVDDMVVRSDRIAGRVRYRGTHGGTFIGVAPTGRAVDFEAFHIVRFRNGKVVEWWGTADLLGALQQVGATVSAPPAS